MGKRHGVSYQKRVVEVNRIYDHYASHGVPTVKYGGGTYILCMLLVSVHSTICLKRPQTLKMICRNDTVQLNFNFDWE